MRFSFWQRKAKEEQLNAELQSHLAMAARERTDRGESPVDAGRAARREFGNVELVQQTTRDQWAWTWFGDWLQDVRYALRSLAKNPGFATVVVITLALGIGANTALFSIVNGVLLNPLPYPHPEQLVTLHEGKPNFPRGSISLPNFLDWQKQNHTFASMALSRGNTFTLTGRGVAEQVQTHFITSDFFQVLGMTPALGRLFEPDEDRIGAAPIAIVTAGFWKRKLGGKPDAIGQILTLDGRNYSVVGVIPQNFDLLLKSFRPSEVYLPLGQWGNPAIPHRDAGLGMHGIGRLKPGVTIEQARSDMSAVIENLARAYPETDRGITAALVPFREDMVGNIEPILFVLLAAVGFVLLIACVNVANLLLARSTGRSREFAIRSALGAGQGRLVRQLLTESVILSITGGFFGLLVAAWGTQAALKQLPAALPRAGEIGLDSHVLFFTLAISLLAGIFFGLAPALKARKPDLLGTLKEGVRGTSRARNRVHGIFVIVEMAMALVLLIGAGLTIRTLAHLWRVSPGFDAHNVLTFGLSVPPSMTTASPEAIRARVRAIDRTFQATPGVSAVSVSWGAFPLAGDDELLFWMDGQPRPTNENDLNWALRYNVGPDFLKAMGIPLRRGRFLREQDDEHSPTVAVVDEVFAKQFFGDRNPIGKRINIGDRGPDGSPGQAEIVGIVGHVKQWGLDLDESTQLRAQIYLPFMQLTDTQIKLAASGIDVVVRSDGSVPSLFDSLRRASQQMSAEQVLYGVRTIDSIVAESLAARRFSMILFGVFAALALLLASVGIFGVLSYLVGQRTNEIGIRIAIGANRGEVLRLVLRQGLNMALIGVVIGLVSALALTRLMAGMLFGVSPTDPLTFAGVAVLLMLVALGACYFPARRAMRVDPVVALRYE